MPHRLKAKDGQSSDAITTTPTMRRFLIAFAIAEAIIVGWMLISTRLR